MFKKTLAIGLIAATSVAAMPQASQADDLLGTIIGGAGGAAVGSTIGKGNGKLVSVAVGTLIGAAVGNSVSRSMDRADSNYYGNNNAYYSNATYYEPVYQPAPRYRGPHKHWRHGHRNYTYVSNTTYVQPEPVVYPASYNSGWSQDYCREYNNTVNIGGRFERSYGKACMQPDGSWQIIE